MLYIHCYDLKKLKTGQARSLLTEQLARYMSVDANTVKLQYNDNGKPTTSGFSFSISHSHEYLIHAFTPHGSIGVDLEFKNKNRKTMALAKRYFHLEEYLYMKTLTQASAFNLFYQLWTTKEAICKAKGGRLWYYLADNCLENNSNMEKKVAKLTKNLHILQFDSLKNFSLTIACELQPSEVSFYNA